MNIQIDKQEGTAFLLKKGDILKVIDPEGGQVSDMVLFNRHDTAEKLSAGKTLDYEGQILISTGNTLWSNRSNKMAEILEDTNGRNDFLLAPCCGKTFQIIYGDENPLPGCLGNLSSNLAEYGISRDDIPTAFNIFMNVVVDEKGKITVEPPTSKPGDYVTFRMLMDVVVGLTACSAADSNGGTFKPIHYSVTKGGN